MGNPQAQAQDNAAKVGHDFVIAKVEGKFLRFKDAGVIPEGSEVLTLEDINKMEIKDIGELYSTIAGSGPKRFKDKKVAIESLIYQIAKLHVIDPNAPKPVAADPSKPKVAGEATPKAPKISTIELLTPTDSEEALKKFAPQARELVLIMADLAKESGSPKFLSTALEAKLKESVERLHTRQDPMRILMYYKGKLVGRGFIRVS